MLSKYLESRFVKTLDIMQEMENIQMPKYEMPEMSQMLTNLLGGGDAGKKAAGKSSKSVAKRKPQ